MNDAELDQQSPASFVPANREDEGKVRAPVHAIAASGDDPIDDAFLVALIAGLAWAPFWLGSDRMFPWGINAVLFPGLTLAYEALLLVRGRRHPVAARRIAPSLALFAFVILWALAQTSPYVPPGFAHPIWAMASDALGTQLPATISVQTDATLIALMRLVTDASVLWLAMQLSRDGERAMRLLQGIGAIVAIYCAYGLVLTAAFGDAIPLFSVPDNGGYVRATFVNRNSFATFAGLGLVVVLGLTLRLYRHEVPDAEGLTSYRLHKLLKATGRRGSLHIAAGVLVLAALLGTVSRGGILAAALGVFAVLALTMSRHRRRRGDQIETVAFVAAVVVGAFVLFGDRIVGRIAASGIEDVSRLAVYQIVANAILDAPLIGFGYGTFADVFPMYRDQSIAGPSVWDMAHNTYLEVWLGFGLVAGTALMAAIGLLWAKCVIGAVKRRRDATPAVVATAAGLIIGVHALVDFSLQIEAVTLMFMAILGAGVGQSESSRHAVSD